MHILHLYKDYFPVLGGIENHIRMLAEAQAMAGHQVTVLVCAPGYQSRVQQCHGVCLIKAGRLATVASMPLSLKQPRLLARLRPDIAHVHAPYPLGEAANWLLGRARATVITYHSDVVRQKVFLWLYAPVLRRVLGTADAIIATSRRYIETSPWLRPLGDRCAVVPLGIDLARFAGPVSTSRSPEPTLLFVGKLRYYKGLDTLLRAMPSIPQARLRVVGDGPMRLPWQQVATTLGLEARVEFVGEIPDAALCDYYATADVFVLPATVRTEAFGTVLLEAMAMGLPVVSTELGTGTSWVNQDGITGLVVPANSPTALATAIRKLLADAACRQRMGKAARKWVEAEFGMTVMLQRVEAVYEQALSRALATPSPTL